MAASTSSQPPHGAEVAATVMISGRRGDHTKEIRPLDLEYIDGVSDFEAPRGSLIRDRIAIKGWPFGGSIRGTAGGTM